MSHNETVEMPVNLFSKSLKIKPFICEKLLDTPLFRLIRFRQKVLTVKPPLELFSLERKGRLLPGGLFVCPSFLAWAAAPFSLLERFRLVVRICG